MTTENRNDKDFDQSMTSEGGSVSKTDEAVRDTAQKYLDRRSAHNLTWLANLAAQKLPGYRGRVRRVSIDFSAPRLMVQGLSLAKLNDGRPEHLLHVGSVVVGSHWKNLLNGSLIAYIRLDSPRLIVNLKRIFPPAGDRDNGNRRLSHDTKTDEPLSWQKKVEQLPPFRISSVVLTNREVQVQGMSSQGGADLRIDHLNLYLDNVTNSIKLAPSLMTKALCKGRVMSTGSLELRAEGYPLVEAPIF
jgi:hypothetical protein